MTPEEIALKYMTPRAIELDRLDRYVRGTQYDGRADWFDNTVEVPLIQRKPCIIDPVVKTAIGNHTAFVLGEGRWPKMTSAAEEDDTEIDEDWGLDAEDSKVLDRFVNVVLVRYASLKSVARTMLSESMSMRAAAVVVVFRRGRLCLDVIRAAWCEPTIDDLGDCTKLVVEYPYIESYYDERERQYKRRCMLYRRVIDATSDTVYLPAQGDEEGRRPSWIIDEAKSTIHGLGFCPVRWYPFMRMTATAGNVDGVAIHEDQLDEIDCLNITLSQKQRAAVMAGDPQAVETGVPEGENPAPMGTASRGMVETRLSYGPSGAPILGPDGRPMSSSGFVSRPTGALNAIARKKGAGVVWRYRDKDSRVFYLTIPGDALKAVDDHGKDVRQKINEALYTVHIDPSQIRSHSELSAKSLETFFASQTGYDDQIRDDFGEKGLLGLVSLALRVVQKVASDTKDLRSIHLPGLKKVLPVLSKFRRKQAATDGRSAAETDVWMPPRLQNVWGRYFDPNEADQLKIVQLCVQAMQGGVTTRALAVRKLAQMGVFQVESPDAVADEIEAVLAEQQSELLASMHSISPANDGEGGGGGSGEKGGGLVAPPKNDGAGPGGAGNLRLSASRLRARHFSNKYGR